MVGRGMGNGISPTPLWNERSETVVWHPITTGSQDDANPSELVAPLHTFPRSVECLTIAQQWTNCTAAVGTGSRIPRGLGLGINIVRDDKLTALSPSVLMFSAVDVPTWVSIGGEIKGRRKGWVGGTGGTRRGSADVDYVSSTGFVPVRVNHRLARLQDHRKPPSMDSGQGGSGGPRPWVGQGAGHKDALQAEANVGAGNLARPAVVF